MTGNISPKVAAKIMNKSPQFVYKALQDGRLPFGTAVQKVCGKEGWVYYISPKQFIDYTGATLQEITEASS